MAKAVRTQEILVLLCMCSHKLKRATIAELFVDKGLHNLQTPRDQNLGASRNCAQKQRIELLKHSDLANRSQCKGPLDIPVGWTVSCATQAEFQQPD